MIDIVCRHRIIIASSAFGLGLDISDIREIIFVSPPRLENELLQQLGRGGRDGNTCNVIIYYDKLERSKLSTPMKDILKAPCIRVSIYQTAYQTGMKLCCCTLTPSCAQTTQYVYQIS